MVIFLHHALRATEKRPKQNNPYHSDGFHGEHGGAKKRGEIFQVSHVFFIRDSGHFAQQIVKRDAQTASHQYVGHHRHGCQILEVWHVAEQYERNEQRGDVILKSQLQLEHLVEYLREVIGNDHGVHAASAEVRDEQQPQNRLPG